MVVFKRCHLHWSHGVLVQNKWKLYYVIDTTRGSYIITIYEYTLVKQRQFLISDHFFYYLDI